MGLFRLLFWIAIMAAAFWLWRRLTRPTATRQKTPEAMQKPAPMVRCQHCGIHVPRDHAIANEQKWFCSQAHLEQGSRSDGL